MCTLVAPSKPPAHEHIPLSLSLSLSLCLSLCPSLLFTCLDTHTRTRAPWRRTGRRWLWWLDRGVVRARARVCAHISNTDARTHTHTHTHTLTLECVRVRVCLSTCVCVFVRVWLCSFVSGGMKTHTRTHGHARTHAHAHTRLHATLTLSHPLSRAVKEEKKPAAAPACTHGDHSSLTGITWLCVCV